MLHVERHRIVVGVITNEDRRQRTDALSEATISLLKNDNICVDFVQNIQNSKRIAPAIRPNRLMDVVTDHFQRGR